MKIRSLLVAALSVAAAYSVQAQTVAANDIIVGFRGNSSVANLEVKAGSVSSLSGYTTETLIGNLNSSLTSTIGSNWSTGLNLGSGTTGGVSWGAAGASTTSLVFASSLWDSTVAGTLGMANSLNGTDWSTVPNVATAFTKISGVYTGFNSVSATATGDGLSKTIANGNSNSWTVQGGTGASAFATFNPNNNGFSGVVGNTIVDGTTYSAMDLYSVGPNTSTFLGTFALYQNGDLTFTAFAAVPEPSTYAAILGAATLGFVLIRRRQQAQVEV